MSKYIIKYAGEISTKQSRTRWRMINKVYSNIVKALKYHKIKLNRGKVNWDFIFVDVEEKALDIIKNLPGIQYLAEVEVVYTRDKDEIINKGYELFKDKLEGKKFSVRCRNKLKKDKTFRSKDIEIELGSALFDLSDGVNLKKPDITCHIEIREEGTFFYSDKIQGIVGFPIGNTGKGIMLLSGGIDSPVAAYLSVRMGITPVFVYFDLGGEEQKQITIDTFKYLYKRYMPGLEINYIEIPFVKMVDYLRTLPHKYQNLLLKYFFYKVSEKLAAKYKAKVVITGEALGQVSTQTIENIILLDKYISYSVFRPTLFMPKVDIIDIAEEIGTLDMSYKGKEYCAIATKNVATGGRKDIFDNIIKNIPLDEIVRDILNNVKIFDIDTISTDINDNEDIIITDSYPEVIIINLGDKMVSESELKMDLNKAIDEFSSWDKSKPYKITCDQGIKSDILKKLMREQGFEIID